jgi:hypothetical protein
MNTPITTAVLLGSLLLGKAQAQQPVQDRQWYINVDGFDLPEVCTFEGSFLSVLPKLEPDFYTDTVHFRYLNDETMPNAEGVNEIWKIYAYTDDGVSSDRVVLMPHSYVDGVQTNVPFGEFRAWRITADRLPPAWHSKQAVIRQFGLSATLAAGDDVAVYCDLGETFHFKGDVLQDVEIFVPNTD